MPTYQYECLSCDHRFDKFQMMTDKPIKTCPKCHKSVRRLIGAGSGIIFKGAGFYATDYRKTKAHQDNKEKEKTDKKTEAKHKKSKESSSPKASAGQSEEK